MVALAAAGCSHKPADEAKGACEIAVARDVDASLAKRKPAIDDSPEPDLAARLKTGLAAVCLEDRWSADVVRCFTTATDVGPCKDGLTPEQRQRYVSVSMKLRMGSRR
ncbi:MAG: hypothetical protein H6Q90_612 [Deltaproteobacteria bacterium]|nr:hypothetical protein [Deltaproteobacteria bacterium]